MNFGSRSLSFSAVPLSLLWQPRIISHSPTNDSRNSFSINTHLLNAFKPLVTSLPAFTVDIQPMNRLLHLALQTGNTASATKVVDRIQNPWHCIFQAECPLSQFSKIVPIETAYLRYAVCGCCLCIKCANCYNFFADWVPVVCSLSTSSCFLQVLSNTDKRKSPILRQTKFPWRSLRQGSFLLQCSHQTILRPIAGIVPMSDITRCQTHPFCIQTFF